MGNKATTGNHDPPQGEVASKIRSEPAQRTVEAPGPAAKEEAPVTSDVSHPAGWADRTTMLLEEKAHVVGLRDQNLQRTVAPNDLFGLALSGGGIRSATFSLGVLQALAERGWIRKLDYVSTVSGGGCIGSWLSACIYWARKRLSQKPETEPGAADPAAAIETLIAPNDRPEEPTEIKFLRAYSSYLTPRLGLLSGDTLAASAGLLRNLAINSFLGAVFIFSILGLIHGLVAVAVFAFPTVFGFEATYIWGFVALVAQVPTFYSFALLLTLQGFDPRNWKPLGKKRSWGTSVLISAQRSPGWWVLSPLCVSFVAGTISFALAVRPLERSHIVVPILVCFFLILLVVTSGIRDAHFLHQLFEQPRDPGAETHRIRKALLESRSRFRELFNELSWKLFGTVMICGFVVCVVVLVSPLDDVGSEPASLFHIIALGPPLATAGFWIFYLILMAVVGNSYSEFTREWLSRIVGRLSGLAVGWLLIAQVIVHARPAWQWVEVNWVQPNKATAFFVACGATLIGFVLGVALRNPHATSKSSPHRLVTTLMSWLATLAVLAVLAVSTVLYQNALIAFVPLPFENLTSYTEILNRHFSELAFGLSFHKEYWAMPYNWLRAMPSVMLLGLFFLLGWLGFRCICVNTFSIQNLYRNRLVRCYLGAANYKERFANPYAGFDPTDDLALTKFAEQRPYLLINATLNLTQGQDLAWQQRKAASFLFSPRWCGYWLESSGSLGVPKGGYVPTANFVNEPSGFGKVSQGVMVGTAMATSGAAVSSQMGFASRGPRAFLMTLLNMRLGRWLPNPAKGSKDTLWGLHSPRSGAGLRCYVSELFGMTNERSDWIHASDGGHFENLGLYELIRRRCHRIICVDAGADPQRAFGDLGNAIQKCRVDFGVGIEINTCPLSIDAIDGRSENVFAIGTINYPVTNDLNDSHQFKGTLIYIKPSIPKNWERLPADILSYRVRHPEFPHERTREQWFSETQFESYRQLGYLIGLRAFQDTNLA